MKHDLSRPDGDKTHSMRQFHLLLNKFKSIESAMA